MQLFQSSQAPNHPVIKGSAIWLYVLWKSTSFPIDAAMQVSQWCQNKPAMVLLYIWARFFFFLYIYFLIQLGCFLQRIQRISCLWHSFAFSCWTAESRGTNVNQSSERQLAIRSTTESPFLEYKPRNTHKCLGVGLLSPLDSHKQTNM